jgi:hypothetical protein
LNIEFSSSPCVITHFISEWLACIPEIPLVDVPISSDDGNHGYPQQTETAQQ